MTGNPHQHADSQQKNHSPPALESRIRNLKVVNNEIPNVRTQITVAFELAELIMLLISSMPKNTPRPNRYLSNDHRRQKGKTMRKHDSISRTFQGRKLSQYGRVNTYLPPAEQPETTTSVALSRPCVKRLAMVARRLCFPWKYSKLSCEKHK